MRQDVERLQTLNTMIIMKSIDCKIFFVALVAFAASMLPETARAQQNIDKVISEYVESSGGTLSYRSVVKRNPSTRRIEKRVVELSVGDKELSRRLVEAFETDRKSADGIECTRQGQTYVCTLIWDDPRRVYEATVNGSWVSYSAVIYY